jgi:hypothetical protein
VLVPDAPACFIATCCSVTLARAARRILQSHSAPSYALHLGPRLEFRLLLLLLVVVVVDVCAGNGNKSEEVIVQLKYA